MRRAIVWGTVGLLLCGCGAQATAATRPATTATVTQSGPPVTPMVMVTLEDTPFTPSNLSVQRNMPIMFMIVNKGKKAHVFKATIPVSNEEIENPATTAPAQIIQNSGNFNVTVPGGGEIDLTITPEKDGTYAVSTDVGSMGDLTVS